MFILQAVIEATEADVRWQIDRELEEFRPIIEAEKAHRNTERWCDTIEQGFGDGIIVPREVIEDADLGRLSEEDEATRSASPAPRPKNLDRQHLLGTIGRKLRCWHDIQTSLRPASVALTEEDPAHLTLPAPNEGALSVIAFQQ